MKKEELRKVEFKHTMDGGYSYQTYKGYFHMWSESTTEVYYEDRDMEYIKNTVALIEDEDGEVQMVEPLNIKFIS